MKKKLLWIFIIFISVLCINVNASTNTYDRTEENLLVPDYVEVTERNKSNILLTPAVNAEEKIYDFADIYSSSDEDYLYTQVSNFIKETNLDLAIVTISYNNKHNTAMYADDFYDYNSFGLDENRSGLLLLVDMDSRRLYLSTTGDAINIYTDDRVNNIMSNIFTYFSSQDYYKATEIFINYAKSYTEVSSGEDSHYVFSEDGKITKSRKGILVAGIFAIIITVISILVMASKNRLAKVASSSIGFLRKDTLNVKVVADNFLGSSVTKTRIDNDSSSGGHHHSSGGGSSTHIGSSGISHGGGGHRF